MAVVNLTSGAVEGTLRFVSGCTELFKVAAVPGARRPTILNLERPECRQAFPAPGLAYWLRPENEPPDGPAPASG